MIDIWAGAGLAVLAVAWMISVGIGYTWIVQRFTRKPKVLYKDLVDEPGNWIQFANGYREYMPETVRESLTIEAERKKGHVTAAHTFQKSLLVKPHIIEDGYHGPVTIQTGSGDKINFIGTITQTREKQDGENQKEPV